MAVYMPCDAVARFLELHEQVAESAEALLRRYRELYMEVADQHKSLALNNACQFVAFSRVGGETLVYKGEDSYYEDVFLTLPLAYLYDDDWETRARAAFDQEVIKVAKEAQELANRVEAHQRREYEKLKAKFEPQEGQKDVV
jgi:hypothetical protein